MREENFYALFISIIKGCSPDHAFELFKTGKITINNVDIEDMKLLKKSLTYKQILHLNIFEFNKDDLNSLKLFINKACEEYKKDIKKRGQIHS